MIKIQDLDFSYAQQPLFNDFFLTMTARQFTAVLGPNGSGKTTLLKILLGLLKPGKGTIYWENSDLSTLSPRERASIMAYVPQNMESSYDFSLRETVMMGRYPYLSNWQKESREDSIIVDRALDLMEISHLQKRSINSISGGERQRVFIARALAQKTPLILLDEPTAFLDLKHQLGIMDLITRIRKEENKTVIAVIHDLGHALNYADQSVLLDKGKIVARGKSEDVITSPHISQVYGVTSEIIKHKGRSCLIPLPKSGFKPT